MKKIRNELALSMVTEVYQMIQLSYTHLWQPWYWKVESSDVIGQECARGQEVFLQTNQISI